MTDQQATAQSTDKIDVHDWQRKINYVYVQMKNEFSASNLETVQKYDRIMVTQGIGKPTRYLHLTRLLSLTRRLKKDWSEATKDDVERVIFEIMDTYSQDGKDTEYTYDHKKVLKIFFRWLKLGNRSYSYCLKKFKTTDPPETEDIVMKKPECKLQGGDLITPIEREWLLAACANSRDRALIDIPLDGGIRPGELLTLQIKNVQQDSYGYVIHVKGKTGTRTVRLIRCTPHLARWLSEHPLKHDPNAPLFIILEKPRYGQPLPYFAARQMILRVCAKTKKTHPQFSKRIFLNLFRHTEATDSAKFMRDGITKKRHGWSPNSKMPSRYSHLVNDDVEEVIFGHYNIKTKEEQDLKLPIKCVSCSMINDSNAENCSTCGKALNLKSALEQEEKDKKAQQAEIKKIVDESVLATLKETQDKYLELIKNEELIKTIKDLQEKLEKSKHADK